MKTKLLTIAALSALLLGTVTSCEGIDPDIRIENPENNENDGNSDDSDSDGSTGTGKDDPTDTSGSSDDVTGDVLNESDFTTTIDLVWNGNAVDVKNGSKLAVTTDGAHVTVGASGAEGQKVRINLSGSTTTGSLKIYNGVKADDTNKKILLSLNGVSITSDRGPAINIQSGKTVYVLLKDGTTNTLADVATYTNTVEGEDSKACFFSEKQLVFSGSGSLSVKGLYKHAICVDDYVHIYSGNITVSNAASDGLHVNDYVRIDGGVVKITSKGEGIQCEVADQGYYLQTAGDVTIVTSGSKSGGVETASDILVEGGNLNITAGGTAAKCLKSDNNVVVKSGTLVLKTTGTGMYDSTEKDAKAAACIKAENNVTLSGGDISCTSTGNGGKGINCYAFECNEGTKLSVSTSGGVYTYSSSSCRPKAIKATSKITINGGDLDIKTTGTEGEGIESKASIDINGGSIVINAKDDGINATGVITVNGGYTYVYSTGNDGIDTNNGRANSIVVNGGVVMAHSASAPEEGFDADNHAYLTFNGGYVFCTGGMQGGGGGAGGGGGPGGGWRWASSSDPTCTQPTVMWNTSASKGYFTLTDASGNVVMSCYVPRALSSNYSMISAPMKAGQSYKCGFTTAAPSGATTVFGTYFYADGTATGLSKSFTAPSGYSSI